MEISSSLLIPNENHLRRRTILITLFSDLLYGDTNVVSDVKTRLSYCTYKTVFIKFTASEIKKLRTM